MYLTKICEYQGPLLIDSSFRLYDCTRVALSSFFRAFQYSVFSSFFSIKFFQSISVVDRSFVFLFVFLLLNCFYCLRLSLLYFVYINKKISCFGFKKSMCLFWQVHRCWAKIWNTQSGHNSPRLASWTYTY